MSTKSKVLSNSPSRAFSTSTNAVKPLNTASCELCQEKHPLYLCQNFKRLSVDERRKQIQRMKRCFNCLSNSHLYTTCPSLKRCLSCKGKHHTLLHRPEFTSQSKVETSVNSDVKFSSTQPDSAQSCLHNSSTLRGSQVLLSTSVVKVKDEKGQWINARCLLDSAATHDFATLDLVQRLKIPTTCTNVKITGIDCKGTNALQYAKLTLKDSLYGNFFMKLNCLVIDHIRSEIPSATFLTDGWKFPSYVKLADPNFNERGAVDILLSAESFWRIFLGGREKIAPGVFARNTKLGWILTGRVHQNKLNEVQHCFYADYNLQEQIEKFWLIEESLNSTDKPISPEESFCEQFYKETTYRNSEGRFVVTMPRTPNFTTVKDSKQRALKSFYATENRFKKDETMAAQYKEFMEEYETLNPMEIVERDESAHEILYLSHHPVWKDGESKSKIRVVFNGSLQDKDGTSLNDMLLSGPALQTNLFDILVNFRLHKLAITADIEKMYRQILIHPQQQDLQRIFWRSSPDQPMKIFRLKTVTYGLKPSSFLAIRTLNELAEQDGKQYDPSAANALKGNFFVDDYLQSFSSLDEAKTTVSDLSDLLRGGGFSLKKFCSNSSDFLSQIPEEDRVLEPQNLFTQDTIVKTLGLFWKPSVDVFVYQFKPIASQIPTKRNILSQIASIYDPIHFIAPVMIQAKIFMQHLWTLKCDWDEVVPQDFLHSWTVFVNGLQDLSKIVIPRQLCAGTTLTSPDLHVFCDASEKAYGCCAYLVNEEDGKKKSSLVCSKSKVAPLKKVTLPRLELCSANLAAELSTKLTSLLHININNIFFWTDSHIVLSWLAQPANTWKTFVANRVQHIKNNSTFEQWYYVPSSDNPADVVSRGCSPSTLANHTLYWQGPQWLVNSQEHWPTKPETRISDTCLELKKNASVLMVNAKEPDIFERFSKFQRLVRVLAYIFRWKNKTFQRESVSSQTLTANEIQTAKAKIISLVQAQCFPNDLKRLQEGLSVDKSSSLRSLNPFVDKEGLIRVNGRINQGDFSQDKKQPIILPNNNHVTRLIIEESHQRNLHVGPRTLLYILREQYWIINGLKTVNSITRKCICCYKINPKPATQLMGELPRSRVTHQRPFNVIGIDYAGPLLLKTMVSKAYMLIFVCMVTRAVHLELVTSANTAYFLSAFGRFTSRRGIPKEVYSDNGASLVKAGKIFNKEQQASHRQVIENMCSENQIVWHFIPPYSPSMGGRWEAQIRILKKHLKSTIGDRILPYEHLNSLLIQIEGILNSRPISPMSSDPLDLIPLTPGHFLIGQALTTLPSIKSRLKELSLISNLKYIKERELYFWQRWKREYLGNLQQRHKWFSPKPNVKIGDLVMIKEPTPILVWTLGRIVRLHLGADKKCRVVEVLTSKGIRTRSLSRISPLPIQSSEDTLN